MNPNATAQMVTGDQSPEPPTPMQTLEEILEEMKPAVKQMRECVLGFYQPATLDLLERIRACLKRWATRFAASPHAVAHVKETLLLIQEIEERLLKGGDNL